MVDQADQRVAALAAPSLGRPPPSRTIISIPEIKFPTKKLRMMSLLWGKPSGVAVSSVSSLLAQLYPTFIVNLAALSTGVAMGFSAIARPGLKNATEEMTTFAISKDQGSWIASTLAIGAVLGAVLTALLGTRRLSRRRYLLLMAGLDLEGWILIATAQNFAMVVAGRFLHGLAAAGYIPSVQAYVSEIAQPQHRATLSSFTVPATVAGTLLSYCLGSLVQPRYVAAMASVIPILLVPGLLFLPDSPHWYLVRGEDRLALKAMERLRSSDANGLSELLAMADSLKVSSPQAGLCGQGPQKCPPGELGVPEGSSSSGSLLERFAAAAAQVVRDRRCRRPFLVLNTLFLLAQFSGSSVVTFYVLEILAMSTRPLNVSSASVLHPATADDSHGDPESHHRLSMIMVGAIRLLGALAFIPAIKLFSQKLLVGFSAGVMGSAMMAMGLAGVVASEASSDIPPPGWVPLVCLAAFVVVEPLGLGSAPFIYRPSELYPAEAGVASSGLTHSVSYLAMFVALKTFPDLLAGLGPRGTFLLYSGASLAAALFTVAFLPETKGKSTEEIEKYFEGQRRTLQARNEPGTQSPTTFTWADSLDRGHFFIKSLQFTI